MSMLQDLGAHEMSCHRVRHVEWRCLLWHCPAKKTGSGIFLFTRLREHALQTWFKGRYRVKQASSLDETRPSQ